MLGSHALWLSPAVPPAVIAAKRQPPLDTATPTPERTCTSPTESVPALVEPRGRSRSDSSKVGYQTVSVSDLRFARLDASAGNELSRRGKRCADGEQRSDGDTYRRGARSRRIARGPTASLLESFDAQGMTKDSTVDGYQVYHQTDEQGERRSRTSAATTRVYVRFSGEQDDDLTSALLDTRTGRAVVDGSQPRDSAPVL